MPFKLNFSTKADEQLSALEAGGSATASKLKKVRRALAHIEANPKYPGLHSHLYENFPGLEKEKIWDSYIENQTPSAWRIFWMYGPNEA